MSLRPARRRRGVRLTDARARAVIRGRVQGVFFRAETRERARSLGLGGWVRNNADGTVEAVFEGDRERIESMLAWCRRGPAFAQVDDVAVDWSEPRGEEGFAAR
ncbi:MAG TPA: acylphosphatase [Gaiellaceae bacterium]|nr:acylphosphatase [Gaiellaceae bacterium]